MDQTFFGPTCMCCLFIILEDSDEDGAEGWIAPASHHQGTFPWLSGRCFVFYSLEIKLCSTLLSWKLNSALLEIRLSSLFHFRSALGPELASNPRACCLSSYQKGLDVQLFIPVFNIISSVDLFCRLTSHFVCLCSFALLHKNCVVYRPTCQ